MLSEKEMCYHVTVDTSLINEFGEMTIMGYQRIVAPLVERHNAALQIDSNRLREQCGVSWVLLSMSMEIKSRIVRGEELVIRTWNTGREGLVFRRELEICHANGEPAVYVARFMALLDLQTRKICKDEQILKQVNLPEGDKLLQASSRSSLDGLQFCEVDVRQIYPSWIDGLGHLNNARYGELVYDALQEKERRAMGLVTRLEFYFIGELHKDEIVCIKRAEDESSVTMIGVRQGELKPAFVLKMYFGI